MCFSKRFIIFIFILFCSYVKAQVYPFSYYSSKNGIPNNIVNQVFQDSKGNIWFATQGGLDVFNGIIHKKFNKASGIIGINITSVAEDKEGAIWIGTTEGVSKYKNGTFTNYNTQNGFKSNFVNHVMCDSQNQIWISTSETGIFVIKNDGAIKYISKEDGLSSDIIFSTYETTDKKIWVATRKGGICLIDDFKVVKIYNSENGFESKSAFSVFEDSKNNIWIGTNGKGLFKFSKNKFHKIRPADIGTDYVSRIQEDNEQRIWVATETKGIMKIEEADTSFIGIENGLTNIYTLNLLIDKSNNIWISTNGGGVNVLKNLFLRKIVLNSSSVGSLTEYKGGIIALTNGLELIKGDKSSLISNDLNGSAILLNEDNSFWLANLNSEISKIIIDEKGLPKVINTLSDSILSNSIIVKLLKVDQNRYWALTFGNGIIEFNEKGVLKVYDVVSSKLASNNLLCAAKNINGEIWVGTSDVGAIVYNGVQFKSVGKKQGLNSLNINAISCDSHGKVFLGTSDDGLYSFSKDKFLHYSTDDNLVSEQITALACDNDNSLWIGTNKGFSHLTFSGKDVTINNYGESSGFSAMEVSSNGIIINKYFIGIGSVDGLYILYRKNLPKLYQVPRIVFDELKINTETQNWHEKNYVIDKVSNLPINLILNFKENRLTFDLRSLDFKDINELNFSYFLEGDDDKWSNYGPNRSLYFANLNPGEYSLHVKARDISGEESNEIVYSFTITPPFYKTWWFLGLCLITIVACIYFYIKNRTQKLVSEKRVLEERVSQRTEYIEKQNHLIKEKHKEITDSINYAERIQRSFLATSTLLDDNLKDYFVYFKPKDIVSGDFYWARVLPNGRFALITADSTGHGVPGAIMSLLNITSLESAIKDGHNEPSIILNHTRKTIIERLKMDGSIEGGKDGMDTSVICFDFNRNKFTYAAANVPIWIVRDNALIELKGDKMPVGKHDKDDIPFTQYEFEMHKGDMIYTLTDGFPDQFGGIKGKKFMYKQLKETLVSISKKPMSEQKQTLQSILKDWMGDSEQVDDITIIGIRV